MPPPHLRRTALKGKYYRMVLGSLMVLVALHVAASPTVRANPADSILERLGTSVEARVVSLATSDLPHTSIEMDVLLGVIKRINANMIFIEVLDGDGYMIYPSKVWPHREREDRLQTLIDRAHALDIHVVPWIKTFFAAGRGQLGPILEQHPEWAAVGSDGNNLTSYELAWFNPAHPEARAFILQAVLELVTDYDIDGLQLDYIRYPNTYPSTYPTLYSYDDYSRSRFAEETGLDPLHLRTPTFAQLTGEGTTLEAFDPAWQQWTVWRESQVTQFVVSLVDEVRAVRTDFPLFFGVIPALWNGTTYPHARFLLNQHWASWVEADYVDGLTPPSYTEDDEVLRREVTNVRNIASDHAVRGPVMIYPSLMVYPDPSILVREIELLREMELPGVRLFSYGRMKLPHFKALWEGPFAEPALIPHERPFLSALRLLDEIDDVVNQLLAEGGLSHDVAVALEGILLPLKGSLADVTSGYATPSDARDHARAHISDEQAARIKQDVQQALASVATKDDALHKGVAKSLRFAQSLIEYGLAIEQRK